MRTVALLHIIGDHKYEEEEGKELEECKGEG
jgi:hypothetical protein